MFISGAFTLFYQPLTTWEDPFAQLPNSVGGYQQLLESAAPPANVEEVARY
jgi:hypothetical protein